MYVVLIGGGRIGTDLVKLLLPEGHDIVLIEKDEEVSQKLSTQFDALVVHGDGTDLESLKDAGIHKSDALVSVTGDDKVNLISAQLADKIFKVPNVIARVNDPKNEGVFSNLGVQNTISTTRASAMKIKNTLGDSKTILTIGGKEAQILEFKVTDKSPIAHRQIKNLGLPKDCIIVSLSRGDESHIPDGETTIRPDDLVTVLTRTANVREVKKLFEPKKKFGLL